MANYEKVEEVYNGIYRLTHKRSVQRQGAGMVKVGSTEWPEGAKYALLLDGVYVAATQADIEAAREARRLAKEAAALEASNAQHEEEAPQGTLATWSKPERCLLRICRKLAKQIGFTDAQFNEAARGEWDAVQ